MSEFIRLHAFFKGAVQGVGFRFYTERVASNFSVAGFVKNLSDGQVEVIAEGKQEALDEFLKEIQSGYLSRYIKSVDKSWEEPTGKFKDFRIRF